MADYPQTHPVMAVARNIVNQILDEAGTDVKTRQSINDKCDQFAARLIESYADKKQRLGKRGW